MTFKYSILLFCFFILVPVAQSREPDILPENFSLPERRTPHQVDYLRLVNLWEGAGNPAGLSLSQIDGIGTLHFSYDLTGGHFHRPQEPGASNRFGFSTESYRSLNDLRFRGRFAFRSTNEKDRRWGNVTDPFRGTPYVFADEQGGDWSKQFFNLNFAISSGKLLNLLYAGLEVDYDLHTGARQNDPRPLNNTSHLRIKPGLILPVGQKSTIGFSGHYGRRNEELSISVVNSDFQHRWYKLRGVGEYRTGFMTGFFRSYRENTLGGGINYSYRINQGELLLETTMVITSEEVTDGTSAFQHGGEFTGTLIDNRLSFKLPANGNLHLIDGSFSISRMKGIEHNQQYDNRIEQWVTFAITQRFAADLVRAGFLHRFLSDATSGSYDWMTIMGAEFIISENRFLLPSSGKMISSILLNAGGKKNLEFRGNNINVGLNAGYKASLSNELSIHPELASGERSVIVRNIIIPDFDFLATDYAMITMAATYSFNLANSSGTPFFIRSEASGYMAVESGGPHDGQFRTLLNISLGMVY